jgi:hypothetical protein
VTERGANLTQQGITLTGIKTLVVEDEPNICHSLLELLPELGYPLHGSTGRKRRCLSGRDGATSQQELPGPPVSEASQAHGGARRAGDQ